LSQSTRLTDGETEFSSLDRVCIPCSAVKTQSVHILNNIGALEWPWTSPPR